MIYQNALFFKVRNVNSSKKPRLGLLIGQPTKRAPRFEKVFQNVALFFMAYLLGVRYSSLFGSTSLDFWIDFSMVAPCTKMENITTE